MSEDIFFGLDNLSRGGQVGFAEYIRFGKGREVGLANCSIFEDKISRGAAMTLTSPDIYRLSRWLDPVAGISITLGTIGHFLYALLFDYAITSFLWVMILMVGKTLLLKIKQTNNPNNPNNANNANNLITQITQITH